MQIVINISEENKKLIDRLVVTGQVYMLPVGLIENLARAVKTGTPLPKGHGDLIDRNTLNNGLIERQKSYEHTFGIRQPINEAVKDGIIIARTHIDETPTIIEADKGE